MGTKVVKVSDLSGEIVAGEGQLARLVVEGHPEYAEPITLEVLPEEVEGELPTETHFVALAYYAPSESTPKRFLMPLDEFNRLFKEADMDSVLKTALLAQQQQDHGSERRTRGRRTASGTQQRINWASPDRAGEPHPGTISEAEKAYVRDHLEEVNARLRGKQMREIDPTDPEMAERYGLTDL